MKRWFWLFFLLIPASLWAQDGAMQAQQVPACKGMASNYDALNLSDEFCSDVQNTFFDNDLGAGKRGGYQRENAVSFGSVPVRDQYGFVQSTATEYLILFAGATMAYSLGSDSFTVIINTVSEINHVDCAKLGGKITCVDGVNAFSFIAGTQTVDVSTDFPRGTMIETHANRLWVGGVPGSESFLYGSKFGNGDIWGLGGNDGDPVQIPIKNQDGDVLNCMAEYADALIIWKRKSFHGLVGKNQSNFTVKELSPNIGCSDDKTVQVKQAGLFWLSQRGLEKFENGALRDLPPFGDPVKDVTDKILMGTEKASLKIVQDTTQNDFGMGVSTYVNASSLPGSIFLSSPTLGAGFTGSLGTLVLPRAPTTYAQSFVATITANALNFQFVFSNPVGPSPWITLNSTLTVRLSDVNFSTRPAAAPLLIYPFPINLSGYPMGSPAPVSVNVSTPISAGTTYWLSLSVQNGCGGDETDPSCLRIYTVSPPRLPNSYLYKASDGVEAIVGSQFVFSAQLSSGSFVSRPLDLGAGVQSIQNFQSLDALNGGGIIYYTRASHSDVTVQTQTWIPQLNNVQFAASLAARFVQYRADFSITQASQNPVVQEVSIFFSNAISKPRLASWIVGGRYYLSGSTNTTAATANETVLVVDKFDNFTKLNGINALSFADAFGRTYFGTSQSSGPESGLYYRMTKSFSDDGRPVDAFVVTKDFCFGPCSQDKYFDKLYVKTKNDGSGGGSLFPSYMFDRNGVFANFGNISLTAAPGLIISRVYFPYDNNGIRGKTVRFKFGNNELSRDFKFYGGEVFYLPSPIQ